MLRSFPLHRANRKADWEMVPENKRNRWQKVAAATNGWVAPANFISLAGALVVIFGLFQLKQELAVGSALLLIAVGRLADIADGYVANLTGTKSPLGSWIDPAIDKILSLFAVIVLWTVALVPPIVLVPIAIQSIFNASIGFAVARKGITLHISKEGKLAMVAIWLCLLLFLLNHFLRFEAVNAAGYTLWAAYAAFFAFLILGFRSSRQYYLDYKSANQQSRKP